MYLSVWSFKPPAGFSEFLGTSYAKAFGEFIFLSSNHDSAFLDRRVSKNAENLTKNHNFSI